MSWFDSYRPTRPLAADDGIRARSQRGQFVRHWWATRWIQALEGLMHAGRLQRGRSYARAGQVVSLEPTRRGIEAKVQGSRPKPYRVKLEVAPLTDAQWESVLDALAERAEYAADLLAGEMPSEIEPVFDAAGAPLFPRDAGELDASCSCPDDATLCKHIAAVYYLLGERFDDDPFFLLQLRGRGREAILEGIRRRLAKAPSSDPDDPASTQIDSGPGHAASGQAAAAPPLEELVDDFWSAGHALARFTTHVAPPSLLCPVLRRLGPAPFVEEGLEALLGPAYAAMTEQAMAMDEDRSPPNVP